MGVIVILCSAFGLAASEIKTEKMCLRTKGMPEYTTTFSVEAAGQVYNQTNEFVYLGGNVNHNADLSIEVNRRIRNAWRSFRCTPSTVRPTERSPQFQTPDAQSRGTRERLRHEEPPRVPLRHAPQSPPRLPDSLNHLAKKRLRRPPDFLSRHAYEDGKLEHRGDFTQKADLVRGVCGAHREYETDEVRDVRIIGGGLRDGHSVLTKHTPARPPTSHRHHRDSFTNGLRSV